MSEQDRIEGTGDELKGKVKEGVGKLTGDDSKEAEGKLDQVKGNVKQGIADAKDKINDAVKKVTE